MPHVEKLADFLVLLPPILLLTSLGTIQGGLAYSAVLELEIRRRSDFADYAAPEHDCCWVGLDWSEGRGMEGKPVAGSRAEYVA
jgi:hypothetical protein